MQRRPVTLSLHADSEGGALSAAFLWALERFGSLLPTTRLVAPEPLCHLPGCSALACSPPNPHFTSQEALELCTSMLGLPRYLSPVHESLLSQLKPSTMPQRSQECG